MFVGKRVLSLSAILACLCFLVALSITPAAAWNRGAVQTLAVLPAGVPMTEGLTVGPDGNVYVSTFDPTGASGPAQVLVFNPQGQLLQQHVIQGASSAMLGVTFQPGTDTLMVIDFGRGTVMKVDPTTGNAVDCVTGPGPGAGLNAMTFDHSGNIYVSGSFTGTIYTNSSSSSICGPAKTWYTNTDLLGPSNGIPPFGANGIEFNKAGTAMFAANTALDWIVKIEISGGQPGKAAVFTNSINGCDGLVLDGNDNLWVAANQADEIVVVDPTGKVIAKLGDFNGVRNGVTNGLLFPASPAFSKDGQWLYVTNLELDLRTIGLPQSVDSQWAAQVQRHSIAKLGARIPPIQSSP
jgi:sugar lactone lactonase YvrE